MRFYIILIAALSVLPGHIILPSLANIAATFNASNVETNFIVSGYAIVSAFSQLFAGYFSDRYGRRPILLVILFIFSLASVGCAVTNSLDFFLICRLTQGVVAGCYPISLAIIKETSIGRDTARKAGKVASVWALAPMLGPTLGGLLDAWYGWRTNFLFLSLLGLLLLSYSHTALSKLQLNHPEKNSSHLFHFRYLLSSSRFLGYTVCMVFSSGTLYIFMSAAPLVVAENYQVSSVILGMFMGTTPFGFILGSILATRLAEPLSSGKLVLAGRAVTFCGLLFGLALNYVMQSTIFLFFFPALFVGIGNGLTMPGANAAILSVKTGLAGTASGLAAAMNVGGAGLIAGLAAYAFPSISDPRSLLALMLGTASIALLVAIKTSRNDVDDDQG